MVTSVAILVGFILGWIASSLSVYLAAKIIGVQVSFLRALVITLFADIIISFIIVSISFSFTSNLVISVIALIIGFVIALIIYKYLFNISWTKFLLC